MSTTSDNMPEPDDIELMLPWLATGKLGAADRARLEGAVAADAELQRRLSLARDELGETVRLNEALGAPSTKAADALFRRIEAEPARPVGLGGRIATYGAQMWRNLARPGSRTLGWAAAAAILLILAQAGGIVLLLKDRAVPAGYETASGPQAPLGAGAFALIGFAPDATAAQITDLLLRFQASIADGPRAGGLYRVRVGDAAQDPAALDDILNRMRQTSGVVRLALPTK